MMAEDARLVQLQSWLSSVLDNSNLQIEPASADASFRRYFRASHAGETWIVMDAPPEKEDCKPFIRVAEALLPLGLHVPEILQSDLDQGFLLLSDLGSQSYLDVLNDENVQRLYGDAMGALLILQACGPGVDSLPPYDETLLRREMELFREWYLKRHLGLDLSGTEQDMLDRVFTHLVVSALEQPRVAVHRDYHSRNLMLSEAHNPGILDFQDAVFGPVTYDLVSLLRDCYIRWPRSQVENWVLGYHELATQSGILQSVAEEQFLGWFDRMGVQRHLKATGIFARLHHRDNKPGYLQDIPRTLSYVRDVSAQYAELQPLYDFLQQKVMPQLESAE